MEEVSSVFFCFKLIMVFLQLSATHVRKLIATLQGATQEITPDPGSSLKRKVGISSAHALDKISSSCPRIKSRYSAIRADISVSVYHKGHRVLKLSPAKS